MQSSRVKHATTDTTTTTNNNRTRTHTTPHQNTHSTHTTLLFWLCSLGAPFLQKRTVNVVTWRLGMGVSVCLLFLSVYLSVCLSFFFFLSSSVRLSLAWLKPFWLKPFPLENGDEVSPPQCRWIRWERALRERGEMDAWREPFGCGTVPSMTLNYSHGPTFVVFFQIVCSDGVEVCGQPCTTLFYVAFTDIESMIGDAVHIQRTPRSMPAACSPTRTMEPQSHSCSELPPLRAANICLGTHSVSREYRGDVSRIIANDKKIV